MFALSFFHIVLASIACYFLIVQVVRFVRGESFQSFAKFVVSFAVWGSILFFALFPEMARVISVQLHIGDNLNTLIFTGFIGVFILIFRLLHIIERMEQEITTLVRANAMSQSDKTKE